MMAIRDIIKQWLKDNGYDGLVDEPGECGCTLDDFMPCCEGWMLDCEPGYKRPCPGEDKCEYNCGGWHIATEKYEEEAK